MSRCKEGGNTQERCPHYIGARNNFGEFNEFAEWCQSQTGYGTTGFNLDKDLLVKGNKVYSPDTCVFLPHHLNMFIISRNKARGRYPVGVTHYKKLDCFRVECDPSGFDFKRHIGYFDTPEEGFAAYKQRKEQIAKLLAEKWRDKIDPRAYVALMKYTIEITD